MQNRISAWFAKQNISSHSIAVVLIGAVAAYATDETVRNAVNAIVYGHPKVTAALSALAAIYLRYSNSKKAQA